MLWRLVYERLVALRQHLTALTEEIVQKVWDVVAYALRNEGDLRLMYRRHVDQVILCSVYGVCKALDVKDIMFRDIIAAYVSQPQSLEEVSFRVLDFLKDFISLSFWLSPS
jgi:hypothetical protein